MESDPTISVGGRSDAPQYPSMRATSGGGSFCGDSSSDDEDEEGGYVQIKAVGRGASTDVRDGMMPFDEV